MKFSLKNAALAVAAVALSAAVALTGCTDDTPAGTPDNGGTAEPPKQEEQKPADSEEEAPSKAEEKVVFVQSNLPIEEEEWEEGWGANVWVRAPLIVTNLSEQAVTFDDFLTWNEYEMIGYEYGDDAVGFYQNSAILCKSVTVKTAMGEVPCVMIFDEMVSSKTLPAGQSARVWLTTLAPKRNQILNVSYKGIHQCFVSYGQNASSGGGSSSATSSTSPATSEAGSSAAASEVGTASEVTGGAWSSAASSAESWGGAEAASGTTAELQASR